MLSLTKRLTWLAYYYSTTYKLRATSQYGQDRITSRSLLAPTAHRVQSVLQSHRLDCAQWLAQRWCRLRHSRVDCFVCQCRDSCDVTRHVEHVSCLTHLSCPHARSRTHRGSAMLSRTPSSAQYAASRVMYRGRGEAMSYAIGARNARRSHYRSHSPIPRPRPLAHVRARRPHWPCTLSCCSSSNSTLAASEPIAT